MEYPIADATTAGNITSVSKSLLYGTSIASNAPSIGVLKIDPMPAPIPTATALLLSSGGNFKTSAIIEPIPEAICAVDPSLPALPPEPIVIAEAIVLTGITLHKMKSQKPSAERLELLSKHYVDSAIKQAYSIMKSWKRNYVKGNRKREKPVIKHKFIRFIFLY